MTDRVRKRQEGAGEAEKWGWGREWKTKTDVDHHGNKMKSGKRPKQQGKEGKRVKGQETAAESTDEKWLSKSKRCVYVCVCVSKHRPSGASSVSWSLGDTPSKGWEKRKDEPESEEGAFLGLEVRLD